MAALSSSSGCATLSGARGGGAVKADEIAARNRAFEGLASTLADCGARGTPEDHGLLAVSAGPSGEVRVDAIQWWGGEAMKACVLERAAQAKLGPWSAGTVSTLWGVGTKEHPAPGPISPAPPEVTARLEEQLAATSGSADLGPLWACAQQHLAPGAYAVIGLRIYAFPDGKVVGATPISIQGEGGDAGFGDCVRELVRAWTLPSFTGPGFIATEVSLRRGVDDRFK